VPVVSKEINLVC